MEMSGRCFEIVPVYLTVRLQTVLLLTVQLDDRKLTSRKCMVF